MAWQIEGRYFETCSCEVVCPCTASLTLGAVGSELTIGKATRSNISAFGLEYEGKSAFSSSFAWAA
jgi:hypothetical protein